MTRPLATIDLGSNTFLLLIAAPTAGEPRILADECRFVRLGEGLGARGRLAAAAAERGLGALREFRELIERHDAACVAAVGTQALREAEDAGDFLAAARGILGAEVEVISGVREAELGALAVTESLPRFAAETILCADVGGRSTELAEIACGELRSRVSLPIGAVGLAERHLQSDPPSPAQVAALFAEIDSALASVFVPAGAGLVGVSGTATTLSAIDQRLASYSAERIHGSSLSAAAVSAWSRKLLAMPTSERKRLPGLAPERADVIPAGAAIYARLLLRAGCDSLFICDRGVRWGLYYETQRGDELARG